MTIRSSSYGQAATESGRQVVDCPGFLQKEFNRPTPNILSPRCALYACKLSNVGLSCRPGITEQLLEHNTYPELLLNHSSLENDWEAFFFLAGPPFCQLTLVQSGKSSGRLNETLLFAVTNIYSNARNLRTGLSLPIMSFLKHPIKYHLWAT